MMERYLLLSGQCVSSLLRIQCGDPQEYVFCPILFLIFINNLYRGNLEGKIMVFADGSPI